MGQKHVICFYRENEEYGCFSNWYSAAFSYAGKVFPSTEHFIMYHKVLMFHQYDLADKILQANNPAEAKKLGKTHIQGFNSKVWEDTCYTIVKRGVRAKFEQSPDLLRTLLETGDSVLAESFQDDSKWGTGVAIDAPERCDTRNWRGANLLGRILMEVREELRIAEILGNIGYIDANNSDFPQWHAKAGELKRNPKYYYAIHAYAGTLKDNHERNAFYFNSSLAEWEIAMRTNMGGGLPVIGFYEMKQDVFDVARLHKVNYR